MNDKWNILILINSSVQIPKVEFKFTLEECELKKIITDFEDIKIIQKYICTNAILAIFFGVLVDTVLIERRERAII
jgi:hypothetical protein